MADFVHLALVELGEERVRPQGGHERLLVQLDAQGDREVVEQRDVSLVRPPHQLLVVQPEESQTLVPDLGSERVLGQVRSNAGLLLLLLEASIPELQRPDREGAEDNHDQQEPRHRHPAGIGLLHLVRRVHVDGGKPGLRQRPEERVQVQGPDGGGLEPLVLDPGGAGGAGGVHASDEVPIAADVVGAEEHPQGQVRHLHVDYHLQ
mmetsp:Transcript_117750/g.327965  ORF Transcript_117750/g.327965 Transcript_117750/m.327965 type:complete len:206 (+) Transcript_117750:690-1307(+)